MARNNTKRRENDKEKREEQQKQAEQQAQETRLQNINNILASFPIMNWAWPRIGLAVLKERTISYADSVLNGLAEIYMQAPYPIYLNYTRTDLARNKLAQVLLASNLTHIVMLDIDHKHPHDIIQRLARWVMADPDKWVVGGLNFRRSYPHDPCCHVMDKDGRMYPPSDWDDRKLMKVDAIGTGSIIIAREAFEAIQPPWFFNIYDQDKIWADRWPGEDMGFSQKCREYGINMYVDTTTTSPHIVEREVAEPEFRQAIANGDLVKKSVDYVDLV